MNSYDIGDVVRLTATFTNGSGVATDPTTVTLEVAKRTLAVSTYTYAAAGLTKLATGVYYRDIPATVEGVYDYRFAGTGAVTAAVPGSFRVLHSQVIR